MSKERKRSQPDSTGNVNSIFNMPANGMEKLQQAGTLEPLTQLAQDESWVEAFTNLFPTQKPSLNLLEKPLSAVLLQYIPLENENYLRLYDRKRRLTADQKLKRLLLLVRPDINEWLRQPKMPKLEDTPWEVWNTLALHPNFPEFMKLFPGDNRSLDILSFGRQNIPFLLEYAPFTQTLYEIMKSKEDVPPPSWSARLANLDALMGLIGLHAVPDEHIHQALIDEQINLSNQPEQLAREFENLDSTEYARRSYILRNRTSTAQHIRLRNMRFPEGAPPRDSVYHQLDWLESRHNPHFDLLPTISWEIEHCTNPQLNEYLYNVLDKLGFRYTPTETELSPGPFRHWRSAQIIFDSLCQTQVTDFYQDKKFPLSMHLNIGGFFEEGLAVHLFRFFQIQGHCWSPRWGKVNVETSGFKNCKNVQILNIKANKDENQSILPGQGNDYWECKSFRFHSPTGAREQLRQLSLIGAAYIAYERVADVDYQRTNPAKLSDPQELNKPIPYLSKRTIRKSELPEDIKRLALIAKDFMTDFDKGINQTNLKGIQKRSISMDLARTLAQTNETVLPPRAPWERDHTDPGARDIPEQHIKYQNHTFPNAVAFARHLGDIYSARVEIELAQREQRFISDLETVWHQLQVASIEDNFGFVQEFCQNYDIPTFSLRGIKTQQQREFLIHKLQENLIAPLIKAGVIT